MYLKERRGGEREEGELTVIDGTSGEDSLLALAEAGVDALVDEHFCDGAVSSLVDVLALALELAARFGQALLVVLRVVDVANRVPLLRLVDRAEVPRAQQALLQELGRRAEVPRVLLVAQVARLHQRRLLRSLLHGPR